MPSSVHFGSGDFPANHHPISSTQVIGSSLQGGDRRPGNQSQIDSGSTQLPMHFLEGHTGFVGFEQIDSGVANFFRIVHSSSDGNQVFGSLAVAHADFDDSSYFIICCFFKELPFVSRVMSTTQLEKLEESCCRHGQSFATEGQEQTAAGISFGVFPIDILWSCSQQRSRNKRHSPTSRHGLQITAPSGSGSVRSWLNDIFTCVSVAEGGESCCELTSSLLVVEEILHCVLGIDTISQTPASQECCDLRFLETLMDGGPAVTRD